MTVVYLIVIIVIAAVVLGAWTRFWELGPCPRCSGKGRGKLSKPGAYNRRCGACGGSGERIRPLALIWPQHREEARRRREKRKSR